MRRVTIAALAACLAAAGCATTGGGDPEAAGPVVGPVPEGGGLPRIELPAPLGAGDAAYLGLKGGGRFSLADIGADVVIIEIFSMYCPHCQKEAPNVNTLYRLIEESPDLKGKVKLIGIGAGNGPFEVKLFRRKYGIRFPLFPDKRAVVARAVKAPGTPTFIGAVIEKGAARQFYFHAGGFGDAQALLETIRKQAEGKEAKK